VGEAIGKSAHTVWSMECGKTKRPRPGTVRKLAEFYGVTPDEIRTACATVEAA
jgi:transcriptional regulator with XRE-family HTH domain